MERNQDAQEFWVTCEVCGEHGDPLDIEVIDRGCRFSQLFPNADEEKDGRLFFDPKKRREQIEADLKE